MLKINMIKIVLKFLFAAALLYWLIESGKLDLSLVQKSFKTGFNWLLAIFAVFISALLAAYRYRILLKTKSRKDIPYLSVLKVNYIGQFFSTVLPGAVTGDVIKLVYVRNLDSKFSKTFLFTITLLDRIMGLSALLFLTGIFSLIYFSEVTALSSKITSIIYVNLFLFSGSVVFLGLLVSPYFLQEKIINIFKLIPFIGIKISTFLEQLFSIREHRGDLLFCFLLSVVIQFLSILTFWIISSPFFPAHMPWQYVFTFIPVGLIATAIPISPGGLGVGHVLFDNLFALIHIDNGASLFNLYFIINFCHNFLGSIPYLLASKPKQVSTSPDPAS